MRRFGASSWFDCGYGRGRVHANRGGGCRAGRLPTTSSVAGDVDGDGKSDLRGRSSRS